MGKTGNKIVVELRDELAKIQKAYLEQYPQDHALSIVFYKNTIIFNSTKVGEVDEGDTGINND